MKKNFLKGFTMLALVVAFALAAAVISANAQANTSKVIANVPFEFSVGYKTMPAGEYSVQAIPSANGLMIQSADGKNSALRLSEATDQIKDKSHARLVFHRYGERYFLAEVWNGLDNTGRQLTKSGEERGVERELTISSASENAHAPNLPYEIVEVAAILR
jgi:hypothetical protein